MLKAYDLCAGAGGLEDQQSMGRVCKGGGGIGLAPVLDAKATLQRPKGAATMIGRRADRGLRVNRHAAGRCRRGCLPGRRCHPPLALGRGRPDQTKQGTRPGQDRDCSQSNHVCFHVPVHDAPWARVRFSPFRPASMVCPVGWLTFAVMPAISARTRRNRSKNARQQIWPAPPPAGKPPLIQAHPVQPVFGTPAEQCVRQ